MFIFSTKKIVSLNGTSGTQLINFNWEKEELT